MIQQLRFFIEDYRSAMGKYWFRGFYLWMSFSIIGLLSYRIERGWYLLFGNAYRIIRVLFFPLLNIIQALSHIDINYHAQIGGGIIILHPSMGVVINGKAIIGDNLTLIWGNVIGGNKSFKRGEYNIGNNCTLGANAVIIGPVHIGDNVKIGAMACVVKDAPSNVTLVGVPAKIVCG